jgi:hypothetical protein
MSYAQVSLTPRPSQAVPVSPFPGDVVVIETVNATMFPTLPEFGAPHPNSSKYPNHRFGWAGDPLQNGSQPLYYVADRQHQHLYNWETDNSSEWPRVIQSFVILRDEFDVNSRDYAPPPPDAIDCSDYQITQVQQRRMDDQRFDSLFVRVLVVRENIIEPIIGVTFDSETGILMTTEKQKVPAGTPGSGISSDGTYSTIEPINSAWSIRTTRKASGIVAQAEGGTANRTYPIVVNYSWPAVLGSVEVFFPTLKSGGLGPAIVRPVWWKNAYNGPCVAEVVETWTLTKPTATVGQTMNPGDIEWNGLLFNFRASNILHRGMRFYETPGTNHPTYAYYQQQQYYGATSPFTWPVYVTSQIDVRPYFGGWLKREIRVYNPHYYALSSGVVLGLSSVDSRGATVQWATGATGTDFIYIKQPSDADFPTHVATHPPGPSYIPSYTFTGLSPGTAYEVKVVVGSITSNILTFTTVPETPVINSDLSPITATKGVPITNRTVTAIGGGTMTYTASGLITGLTFDSGLLSGTPTSTVSGIYEVDVTASNSVGSVTETIVITYSAPPIINSSLTATALQGSSFTYTISATNTPTIYSATGLPAGLTLTGNVISGTPTGTASGNLSISIRAENTAGFDAKTLVVAYTAKPIITAGQIVTRKHSTAPLPYTVQASNSPTSWSMESDNNGFFSDHSNMRFDTTTGVISVLSPGTLGTHQKTYLISFKAYNDAGSSAETAITYTVNNV